MSRSPADYQPLIQASSFRASLAEALKLEFSRRGRVNLSEFSRRAGFSSRSYLSELLAGRKGLSRDALGRIKSALNLPRPYLELIELRAWSEAPELLPRRITPEGARLRLETLQERLRRGSESQVDGREVSRSLKRIHLLPVFAALGSETRGASLEEIRRKTGHSDAAILEALEALVQAGAASRNGTRYYPKESRIDVFGLGSEATLHELIDQRLTELRMRRKQLLRDESNLVFVTALSLRSWQLAEFRQKLQDAIYEVLDQYQDDDGDTVHQILFACHGPLNPA